MKLEAALLVAALSSPAYPEMIRLSSGSLTVPDLAYGNGPIHLEGSRGFSFEGYAGLGVLDVTDCYFGCDPGETISVGAYYGGSDLPGVAELTGTAYPDVGAPNSYEQLEVKIQGQGTIPRLGRVDAKTLNVRGTVTGTFYHGVVPLQIVAEPLKGRTVATLALGKYDGRWVVESVKYSVK
jgi:hypothetical protein